MTSTPIRAHAAARAEAFVTSARALNLLFLGTTIGALAETIRAAGEPAVLLNLADGHTRAAASLRTTADGAHGMQAMFSQQTAKEHTAIANLLRTAAEHWPA